MRLAQGCYRAAAAWQWWQMVRAECPSPSSASQYSQVWTVCSCSCASLQLALSFCMLFLISLPLFSFLSTRPLLSSAHSLSLSLSQPLHICFSRCVSLPHLHLLSKPSFLYLSLLHPSFLSLSVSLYTTFLPSLSLICITYTSHVSHTCLSLSPYFSLTLQQSPSSCLLSLLLYTHKHTFPPFSPKLSFLSTAHLLPLSFPPIVSLSLSLSLSITDSHTCHPLLLHSSLLALSSRPVRCLTR